MPPRALALVLACLPLVALACSGAEPRPGSSERATEVAPAPTEAPDAHLKVVTTSNIVADWVREIGGDRVEVFSLISASGDPHQYQPGARDVVRVADADLVLSIGLNLEGAWLTELVRNASVDPARYVTLGDVVDPLDSVRGDTDIRGAPAPDPHFWFDPARVRRAVTEIATRLSDVDPAAGSAYVDGAAAYGTELAELHSWIQAELDVIPAERRHLVTVHDSLQYFARAYGLEVLGTVVAGVTTETEPSADRLAELVDEVRAAGTPAVFTEASGSDRLARAVADEIDGVEVRELRVGSLGAAASGAGTYVEMMRSNVTVIVEALR